MTEVILRLMHPNSAALCSSQGENQAGLLHVQPHVWRNRQEEPDEAGS